MLQLQKTHPFALFFYFLSQITITMIFFNPIIILISLAGILLFKILSTSFKGIFFYIIFFVILALSTPLFTHKGGTVLFYLNGSPITYEAFIYGLLSASLILSVFMWLTTMNFYISHDKIIYLIGKVAPKTALLISISLHFIPNFIKKGKEIYSYQNLFNSKYKIKNISNSFLALISQSLENSIQTADSMSAKGYGSNKRSSGIKKPFTFFDIFLILVSLILLVVIFICSSNDTFYFYCYPFIRQLDYNFSSILGYISFGVLTFLPSIIFIWSEIKWKCLISKI